jgi:hypothetical protein
MDLSGTVPGDFLEQAGKQLSGLLNVGDFSSLGELRLSWFSVSVEVRRSLAAVQSADPPSLLVVECAAHCLLLHDLFGPLPFREITVEPSWRTSDVLALARGIYNESRSTGCRSWPMPSRMPGAPARTC